LSRQSRLKKILNALYEKYFENASSADFNTANAFAASPSALEDELAVAVTDRQAFRLSGGVPAADGGLGARRMVQQILDSAAVVRRRVLSKH
jgi:hypothetical protein